MLLVIVLLQNEIGKETSKRNVHRAALEPRMFCRMWYSSCGSAATQGIRR